MNFPPKKNDAILDFFSSSYPEVDSENWKYIHSGDSSLGFDKCSASFLPTTTSHKIHSIWLCYHKARRSNQVDTKYRPCGVVVNCDVYGLVSDSHP